jgi:7,8-dihydroneopterin aldolase/epimerase/oxygenase
VSGGEDVRVEISGLEAFGPHGVTEAEREVGTRVVLDIAFTVPAAGATASDELEGTVDYGAVGALASRIARERGCRTLERLCAIVADEIEEAFGVADIEVRIAKPDPPVPEPVAEVAVTLRRGSPR